MVKDRDKALIGGCLLAIFISGLVLGLTNDPPVGLIMPFVVIIFVSVIILVICGADAVKPGIFDSCADPEDLARRDAMREARITDTPV